MAFFLIGKGPDDDLRLVSPSLFATRQDAMAELSRLSADPTFAHWDDEVAVIDFELGVPVLLVRPQAAAYEPVIVQAEGGADAWVADITTEAPAEPAPASELLDEGSEPDLEAVLPVVIAEQPAEEPEPELEPVVSGGVAEPEPEPDAEPEAEAEAVAEPELAPETPAAVEESSDDDLRSALLRTTEQMSAEGITPPPSAGLSWAPVAIGEALSAAGIHSNPLPEESEAAAEEPADADEAAVDAAPLAPAAAWPWTSGTPDVEAELGEAEAQQVYSDGSAQDAAVVAEPEAAESEAEPAEPEATEPPSQFAQVFATVSERASGVHGSMSSQFDEPAAAVEAPETESDFILDLDAIQPVAIAEPASEPAVAETPEAPESHPLTEYTCDDCVYVATCPNRDHRLPKDCGSFQWK